jgi:hypothetical protein
MKNFLFFVAVGGLLTLAACSPRAASSLASGTPSTFPNTSVGEGYALLHLYRVGSISGEGLSYDLYLGDSLVGQVSNGWRRTLKVAKLGTDTLWADARVGEELPVNLLSGREYFVSCGMTTAGRPRLDLVDNATGRAEAANALPLAAAQLFQAPRLRATASGGWSYRTAALSGQIPQSQDPYAQKLKSGFHYDLGASYYPGRNFGLGLRYHEFRTSSSASNAQAMLPDGNVVQGKMADNVRISFAGAVLSARQFTTSKRSCVLADLGLGYLNYGNKSTIGPASLNIGGSALGLYGSLSYDLSLTRNLALGLQLSYLYGTTTISSYEQAYNGQTQTIKLASDNRPRENLSQLALSLGIRFSK